MRSGGSVDMRSFKVASGAVAAMPPPPHAGSAVGEATSAQTLVSSTVTAVWL